MQVKLRIQQGSNAGKEIAVRGSKFIIGRGEDCNLRPHSEAISRRHCVIVIAGEVVGLRDLKSRNGTYLNGERISGDKRLRHGDQLRVGPIEFEVLIQQPQSIKPAAVGKQAVGGSGADSGAMGGMVSQWLEEADEYAREENRLASPETREYRFDETSRIALEAAAEAAPNRPPQKGTEEAASGNKKGKKGSKEASAQPPRFSVKGEQPKDTQEAAAQVLRKLFNRGG